MKTRKDLERREQEFLAPFAVHSGGSLGRLHSELEHDYRTAFQRDRDRVVHSRAFRRLEYKTQVFVNHEGDYYRTRLTHTLEVAQIARTMARALDLNEDLAEGISLAHDLGHTPFGHSGQDVMARLMANYGGFEHNKQSFRIVTFLEDPYAMFKGLNLSYEVLEGIAKHSTQYDMPDGTLFIREGYPSLEAQLCNFADEIAYNNHDIDDGLKSGLLELGDLRDVPLWEENFQRVINESPNLDRRHQIRMTVKSVIDFLVTDLVINTAHKIAELQLTSADDVRMRGKGVVDFSTKVKVLNSQLKKCLFAKLYRHYRVERMAEKAERILEALFNAYTKNPRIVPPNFMSGYQDEPIERIVCDYIAGMTDRFALQEHKKLFDPFEKV